MWDSSEMAAAGLKKSANAAQDSSERYRVQVLERAFDLLDALAGSEGVRSLNQLCDDVGLHKSTTHRLLKSLEARRYVERTPAANEYRLGLRPFELGMRAISRLSYVELARPHLDRLAKESGETAHLGILRQGEIVSLVHAESGQTLHMPSTVGRRTPVHCSSQGKIILASLPKNTVEEILREKGLPALTPKTLSSRARFLQELKRVRARGYAVDDEEFERGLRCIGAPVCDHSGRVIAAISIAGPVFRVSRSRIPELSAMVIRASEGISNSLGAAARKQRAGAS
jgi:DNA-binding IclR family transcriptional regulator